MWLSMKALGSIPNTEKKKKGQSAGEKIAGNPS